MPLNLYEAVRGQVKVIMLQEVSRLIGHSVYCNPCFIDSS